MKNFTKMLMLTCCSLLIQQFTIAQVNIMSFVQSSGSYTEITGGVVYGNETTDDQRFVDPAVPLGGTVTTGVGLPIGFDFTINGQVFDRLAINANGWISLGNSSLSPAVNIASSSSYTPLSSTSVITPTYLRTRIAAFGADLQGQTGASIRLETIGSAPNRVCVVQWKNYRRYLQTGISLNFQIRLNETTNTVEIVYGDITANATSNAAHVGIGGSVATDFINRLTTAPHDWNTTAAGTANTSTCTLINTGTVPAPGLTFTFNPPAGCTGTPNAGTAAGPSGACSGVAFNVTLTGYTTGTGIGLQWQSSPVGAGTWTNIAGATAAIQSVSQSSATDYRCIVTCSNSNESAVSNVVSVTMNNFLDCYCLVFASSAADEDLGNVTIGTLDNTSTCASVGPGTGSIQNRYSNYKTLPPTDLVIGETVSFSLTSITCGGNYGNKFAIYIDFNQDGDFIDPGEELFDGGHAVGPHTATGTFVVPTGALTGVTGMRVINAEVAATTNITACGAYTWGETEDYLVNILPPPPCEGTPNPGSISGTLTVCPDNAATLTVSGYSTGTGLEFQWQSSTDGTNFSDIPGATGTTYTSPALTANTWYQVVVTCVPSSSSATTSPVQITVAAPVAGTVSGPTTMIAGIVSTFTVTGSSGNIQWQVSTDGVTFNNIPGATSTTQTLAANATGTFHLRVVASLPGCPDEISNVLVTVVSTPTYDAVCNAVAIPVDGTNYGPYSNYTATVEAGEPAPPGTNCAGPMSWCSTTPALHHTIWFTFVAPASGTVKIESFTVGGSTDNQLAVYSAPSCSAILNNGSTLLAANDDANSGGNTFTAAINYLSCLTPGQTYYIQLDAYGANGFGLYNIKITALNAPATPTFSGLPASMCVLDAPVALTPSASPGTFSGNGVTGNTFNPGNAGIGTHVVTYALSSFSDGCHSSSQTVEVTGVALYPDLDGDGYGQLNDPSYICTGLPVPTGFAPNPDDCDDTNSAINPGATVDICGNGIDENCDGEDNSIFDFSLNITPDCKGTTKNKITVVSIVGGVAPFTYSRGGPFQSSPVFSNVPAGTYTITVRGADGCERSEMVELNAPMSVSGVITDATCAGFADGSIDLSVTSGYPGYSFLWENGSTDEDRYDLPKGTYKATITDAMGCEAKFTGKIAEPKVIKVKLTVTPVNCNGESSGAILNEVTGGTGQFTFSWSNGDQTQNLMDIPAGSYTVTVTDLSNTACTSTKTALVTEPPALVISGFTMKEPKCFGSNEGSLKVTAGGGKGTKTYAWSNGGTTQTITNLTAGTYTVTVSDANGCTVSGSHVVTQPAQLQIVSITSAPNNIGSFDVTITAAGGTPAYKASRDGVNFGAMIIKKVPAGTYTFTVRDKNLCQVAQAGVVIPVAPRPAAQVTSRNEQINPLNATEATNFRLMPNPTTTSVTMLFDGAFDANGIVEVHTASGRLVKRINAGNLTQDGNTLRLEDLPSGILMVSFVSDNQRVTKRLVVLNK